MIYDDLEYEQEADIFANQKKHTRPLKSIEIFNAHIEAESDVQLTIKSIVESYNLTISSRKIPGHISAVSALEYIFDKYGYHVLDRTLFLLVSTWEGEVDSLGCNMLKGMAKLIVAYNESLNDEQFVDRLSKVSVREIIRTAKDLHDGTQGYAKAMLLQYNKRLKYPLRWNSFKDNSAADTSGGDENMQISMGGGFANPTVTNTGGDDDDADEDDFDDEEVPDHTDALPNQTLMDNLHLARNN